MTNDENLPVGKDLQTIKRLPPSIRGTIYEKMVEAISEEFSVWRDQIKYIKTLFYDIDRADIERLREICDLFGVPLYLSIKSDIGYVREEVRSIPFKIAYRGTPTLYKSFFTAIGRLGEVMIYTYWGDSDAILRLSQDPISEALKMVNQGKKDEPFRHKSDNNYTGYVKENITLDEFEMRNGELQIMRYLDDARNELWHLDTAFLAVSTNHIGVEYFIDRIIERKNKDNDEVGEFLMTTEYLEYLAKNIDFARRAKEVPHIGSQLSIQLDASGLTDSYKPNVDGYTVPSLKLKAVVRSDIFDLIKTQHEIVSMEFGVGVQELPSTAHPDKVDFPTDLKSRVCTSSIVSRNCFGGSGYFGVCGEYIGQKLSDFEIPVKKNDGTAGFDGNAKSYSFILSYAPIQKGSVNLRFKTLETTWIDVTDDMQGGLSSSDSDKFADNGITGKINYRTGECTISTSFNKRVSTELNKTAENQNTKYEIHIKEGAVPGEVELTWATGEGVNARVIQLKDTPMSDGEGKFENADYIQDGEIHYNTGYIKLILPDEHPANPSKNVSCTYLYPVNHTLPEETALTATYFFTETPILITEAGLRDANGNLVAYSTFPPFEFKSSAYHLNFMMLWNKA